MAIYNSKFNVSGSNGVESCKIYSTTNEAGNNRMQVGLSNGTGYVVLGSTNEARTTKGRVTKGNTTYGVLRTAKPSYSKNSYYNVGTYTFTTPEGVTRVLLTLAGAGGGGGGYACNEYDECRAGGNGGNGHLYTGYVSVSENRTYSIVVGAGGSGGRSNIYIGTYNYRGDAGGSGSSSSAFGITAGGGAGGAGATIDGSTHGNLGKANNGSSAGNGQGGTGGLGGYYKFSGGCNGSGAYDFKQSASGNNGWCIVEYGGDI